LIQKDKHITIEEMCAKTGLSPSGVKKAIKKLKDTQRLTRVGGLKGGHWELIAPQLG
jgi:DeoR/GlpR family transcriptional regulator of sugar metabolism